LQETSPAINTGIAHEVYATFYNTYGIDIKKDMDGATRQFNSLWDIGAYEYGATVQAAGTRALLNGPGSALMTGAGSVLIQ